MIGRWSSKQIESIPNFYVNVPFPRLPTRHQTQGSSVPPSGGAGTRPLPAAQNLSGIILATALPCDGGVGETLALAGGEGRRTMCWKGCRHTSRVECELAEAGEVPLGVVGGEVGSTGVWWRGSCETRANGSPRESDISVDQALPVSSTVRGPNAYHTLIKILHLQGIFNII